MPRQPNTEKYGLMLKWSPLRLPIDKRRIHSKPFVWTQWLHRLNPSWRRSMNSRALPSARQHRNINLICQTLFLFDNLIWFVCFAVSCNPSVWRQAYTRWDNLSLNVWKGAIYLPLDMLSVPSASNTKQSASKMKLEREVPQLGFKLATRWCTVDRFVVP